MRALNLNQPSDAVPQIEMSEDAPFIQPYVNEHSTAMSSNKIRMRNQANLIKNRSACSSVEP